MPPTDAERTLRDVLRSETRLSFERTERILTDLAAALAPMHAAGRAHGAITPQSVRIDAEGLHARLGPPGGDRIAMGLLPPAYLAPEVIDGEPFTPRSDVYTLGLFGWEMLVGQAPWAGESVAEVLEHQREDDLPRLTTLRPGVPRHLLLAIEGAIHKSPTDRWADASEMLSVLRPSAGATVATEIAPDVPIAAVSGPIEPAPRQAPWVPTSPVIPVAAVRRPRRRGKPFAMVALVLAVLLAGGAALASIQGRNKQRITLDSVTTSTAAGVIVTDDTTSSAARIRMNHVRDSLAAAAAAMAPPPIPMTPYPPTSYPSTYPPPAPYPTTPTVDPQTAAEAQMVQQAEARARARARAVADSIRRAVADSAGDTVVTRPQRPTLPQPILPPVDSTPRPKAPTDSTKPVKPRSDSARPKPDSTVRRDTIP